MLTDGARHSCKRNCRRILSEGVIPERHRNISVGEYERETRSLPSGPEPEVECKGWAQRCPRGQTLVKTADVRQALSLACSSELLPTNPRAETAEIGSFPRAVVAVAADESGFASLKTSLQEGEASHSIQSSAKMATRQERIAQES